MVVDHLEWIADERFATLESRAANAEACVALLDELFAERTLAEWEDVLRASRASGTCSSRPVGSATTSRSWPTSTPSSSSTTATARWCSCRRRRSSAARCTKLGRGPALGADTDDLLAELGFDDTAIADLRARGVVG